MSPLALIRSCLISVSCLFSSAKAQSILHIASTEDHQPLPYASIVNYTKHLLLFSDEQGNISVDFQNGDSVSISYVGYRMLTLEFKATAQQELYLEQIQNLLTPVKIASCNNWKSVPYTNLDKNKNERPFGGVGWDKGTMNRVAIMLTPDITFCRLKTFSLWLKVGAGGPKNSVKAPLRLSFYTVDDTSKLPGELISNKQVMYYPKKEGEQKISLDSIHLKIPENGIYVCIEYIIIDGKYDWPVRYLNEEKGVDSIIFRYGANLDGVFAKGFCLAFYNYQQGTWSFPGHRDKSILNTINGTIKCTFKVAYCDEDKARENTRAKKL